VLLTISTIRNNFSAVNLRRVIRHQRNENVTSMKNSYSQKIQQPMTNKNMWSRFLLKMFTLLSSAVNSAAVNSVIVTSARLVVVNDISWWRRQWGCLSLQFVTSCEVKLKTSHLIKLYSAWAPFLTEWNWWFTWYTGVFLTRRSTPYAGICSILYIEVDMHKTNSTSQKTK